MLGLEVRGQPLLEQRSARTGREPARAERLGDGGDLLLADRRRLEAELVLRLVRIDLEAYGLRRTASPLERVGSRRADGEDRARPVGAATQRPEPPPGPPVDWNPPDPVDRRGLVDPVDRAQLPRGATRKTHARAADLACQLSRRSDLHSARSARRQRRHGSRAPRANSSGERRSGRRRAPPRRAPRRARRRAGRQAPSRAGRPAPSRICVYVGPSRDAERRRRRARSVDGAPAIAGARPRVRERDTERGRVGASAGR